MTVQVREFVRIVRTIHARITLYVRVSPFVPHEVRFDKRRIVALVARIRTHACVCVTDLHVRIEFRHQVSLEAAVFTMVWLQLVVRQHQMVSDALGARRGVAAVRASEVWCSLSRRCWRPGHHTELKMLRSRLARLVQQAKTA